MSKTITIVSALAVGAVLGVAAGGRLMNAPAEAQTAATTAPVSFSAVPGAIGAEDVSGPYEVQEGWPQDLATLPGHEKWTYGGARGIFAESPNRVLLLGGGELPRGLQSALKLMAADARIEHAQTDSGTYRGRIIADTEKNLVQQITSHTAVIHRKELLDMIPAIGESVRVAYSNDNARVLPVKERSKTQGLVR